MGIITILDLLAGLAEGALSMATKASWPDELITAIQKAVDAIGAIHNDPVTKAQLESLRG